MTVHLCSCFCVFAEKSLRVATCFCLAAAGKVKTINSLVWQSGCWFPEKEGFITPPFLLEGRLPGMPPLVIGLFFCLMPSCSFLLLLSFFREH